MASLTRRARSRFTRVGVLLLTLTMLLSFGSIAGAVHSGGSVNNDLFELGPVAGTVNATNATNIILNAGTAGPDWNDVCDNDANGDIIVRNSDASSTDVIPDAQEIFGAEGIACIDDDLSVSSAVDDTVFASSNKNGDDPDTWNWDTGNTPVKDDLSNVYGYAVIDDGDLVVYAGLERLSPNGDAHVDIEFNQDEIMLDKDAPCGDDLTENAADGSPCEFDGDRTANDLIVSLDYTNGGALGSLEVRRWNGSAYVEVVQLASSGCNALIENGYDISADAVCGFTNTVAIAGGDWDNYDSHAATITNLPTNAFAEFGVNVNEVFNLTEAPCFSTINAHTRSSQSFTSELKDFASASFELCAPSTSLSVSASDSTVLSGGSVTLTYTETNDGIDELTEPSGGWIEDDNCSPVTDVLGESNADAPDGDGGTPASDATHNVGDLDNDDVMDPGETWTFACTDSPAQTTTYSSIGHGIDGRLPTDPDVTYCETGDNGDGSGLTEDGTMFCDLDEDAEVTVTVINPSTALSKTVEATLAFHYYETNDEPGSELTAVSVEDDKCTPVVQVFGEDDAGTTTVDESDFNVGDDDLDGKLDGGETWEFTCTVTVAEGDGYDEINTATGHGTEDRLDSDLDVTYCTDGDGTGGAGDNGDGEFCDLDEQDQISVTILYDPPAPE